MRVRAHTGRSRNDAARDAILRAAAELLAEENSANFTVDAIAKRANAGKQTIYRWWPSKGAVLLEAMVWLAELEVPTLETGDLRADLTVFVHGTFAAAAQHRTLLLGVLREALGDPATYAELEGFAASRRTVMRKILLASRRSGQIPARRSIDIAVDQAFGLLWYRLIFANAPLDDAAAAQVVEALVTQLQSPRRSAVAPTRPGVGE
jgi:AcrR family transcriptional regulator